MKKEIRCIITGRVQLVMFRDFAKRRADSFELLGTVKNLADRSVAVVAQGEEAVLLKYIKQLEKGSVLSRVDKVSTIWREPTTAFSDFEILY